MPGAALLLAPAGLFGLLAIAIPVVIHLISRGRGRRVLVGNIELVRAARQSRVTALRLTEWLLLLLRIAIVVVAMLLLARLALQGSAGAEPGASYVTPGWLRSATDTERAELLALEPAARVLTTGYPPARVYDPELANEGYDAWPLLAERLCALRQAGSVGVYAAPRKGAYGSHRPKLPNAINWRLAAAATEPLELASRGLVIHDNDQVGEVRQLERALAALKRHRVPQLAWETCPSDDITCISRSRDWVAWLADAEPPGDLGEARLFRPQGPTWRQNLSDPLFPEVLLAAPLSDAQQPQIWLGRSVDRVALDAGAESPGSVPLPHRPLHLWLGLLLAALWAIERLLSERRRTAND